LNPTQIFKEYIEEREKEAIKKRDVVNKTKLLKKYRD
jgi:predicted dithiol-disulfide oxidoreductase (DUF899 family)